MQTAIIGHVDCQRRGLPAPLREVRLSFVGVLWILFRAGW